LIGSRYKCQYVQQHATPSAFTSSESWVILLPIEQSIKRKIEAVGKPLKDWDIQIYRGVLTGCNEAFIIDEAKRAEILSNCQNEDERKRTEAIIRPILRGRDIRRYGYDWAGLYIVYIPWHFPLHLDPTITGASEKAEEAFKTSYPSVYNHLEGYKDTLKKRNQAETGIRYEWYALQRWGANYWEEFEKPKLFYADICRQLNFCYSEEYVICSNSAYFISSNQRDTILYLEKYLNHRLINWYYRTISVQLGNEAMRMFSIYVLNIPIPVELYMDVYMSYQLSEEEVQYIEHLPE